MSLHLFKMKLHSDGFVCDIWHSCQKSEMLKGCTKGNPISPDVTAFDVTPQFTSEAWTWSEIKNDDCND